MKVTLRTEDKKSLLRNFCPLLFSRCICHPIRCTGNTPNCLLRDLLHLEINHLLQIIKEVASYATLRVPSPAVSLMQWKKVLTKGERQLIEEIKQ